MSRALAWKLLAVSVVSCLLFLQWRDPHHRPDFSDFKVYWLAGEKAANHRTVYDVEGHYQYKYSPFVALLWGVPHLLPGQRYHWAMLHYAACGVGFLALWFAFARAIDRRRSVWLWLTLLVVFSVALRDELKLGQANLWPMLLVLPAWFVGERAHAERRGPDWKGLAIGAMWGFAIQWKLYALVLAPLWLLRKRACVFVGAIAFTVLSLWGALAIAHGSEFAIAENARWLRSLLASSEELLVSRYNVSTLGILGKWGRFLGVPLGAWAYAVWAGLAAACGATLWWAERVASEADQRFMRFWSASWAWALIVVLNPLVWPYWLMFCLPLFLAYVSDAALRPRRDVDLGFCTVCGLLLLANWLQNTALVHKGVSLVAVLALLFDAQRRARRRRGPRVLDSDDVSTTPFPLTQRSS